MIMMNDEDSFAWVKKLQYPKDKFKRLQLEVLVKNNTKTTNFVN